MADRPRLLLAIAIALVAVAIPIKRFIDSSNAYNEAGAGMKPVIESFSEQTREHERFSEKIRREIREEKARSR